MQQGQQTPQGMQQQQPQQQQQMMRGQGDGRPLTPSQQQQQQPQQQGQVATPIGNLQPQAIQTPGERETNFLSLIVYCLFRKLM